MARESIRSVKVLFIFSHLLKLSDFYVLFQVNRLITLESADLRARSLYYGGDIFFLALHQVLWSLVFYNTSI